MKISKRLAQCLHPALPSGVHLKALETYDIMFRTMGTNRLSQELFIYSSGNFSSPFLILKPLQWFGFFVRCLPCPRYCIYVNFFLLFAGLFPVLSHAATNVKPSLLTIYENHFIPLGEKLIPGLNGFLSGVLPGLEEGTDYYDRYDDDNTTVTYLDLNFRGCFQKKKLGRRMLLSAFNFT